MVHLWLLLVRIKLFLLSRRITFVTSTSIQSLVCDRVRVYYTHTDDRRKCERNELRQGEYFLCLLLQTFSKGNKELQYATNLYNIHIQAHDIQNKHHENIAWQRCHDIERPISNRGELLQADTNSQRESKLAMTATT